MDALRASYGSSSSDEESDSPRSAAPAQVSKTASVLPPPPLSLLDLPKSIYDFPDGQSSRVRSFPHVEGNYALHVYISVYIPTTVRKELTLFVKKVASLVPALHLVDIDVPLDFLCKDEHKLGQALGREFHISLGRTVPIRVHQIDSIVSMLCQKLQFHKRYWIDFSKWETFVNDDLSRTFLSMEIIAGGLMEIRKQIESVNEIYRLHNLPEFYKDARPHISLAWALGDISKLLNTVIQKEIKRSTVPSSSNTSSSIFSTQFSGIQCKIGKKVYQICKLPHQ